MGRAMTTRVISGASLRGRLRARAGGVAFPLDGLTVPSFAYATRALTTGYSGSVARFRATSGPDNTVDVAADSNGRISALSAVTWVSGGGSSFSGTLGNWITTAAASGGCASGNAFVVRLNDQIGTNHWTMAVAVNQPYAVESGALCVNSVGGRMAARNPSADRLRRLEQTSNPVYSNGAWTLVGCQASLVTDGNPIAGGIRGFGSLATNFVFGLRKASAGGLIRGQSIFNSASGVFDGQYNYTPASTPKVYSWNARFGITQVVHENASTDFSVAAACIEGLWPGAIVSAGGIGGDTELPCDTFCLIGYNAQQSLTEIATLRSRLVTEYGAA
jgi:hypothetical protein